MLTSHFIKNLLIHAVIQSADHVATAVQFNIQMGKSLSSVTVAWLLFTKVYNNSFKNKTKWKKLGKNSNSNHRVGSALAEAHRYADVAN